MTVLAILAHPDDMEIYCAGTLLKYHKQGHKVVACHLANGNMGHFVIMPDELASIREKEAQAAAAIAGYEVINGGFGDLTINSANEKQLEKVIEIIRKVKPDVIITHDPEDYASDHTEVSKLVFTGSFSASCPHFKPELGESTPITPIYYTEHAAGVNFVPTEFVDITEEMETKEAMLKCHQSQLKWLLEHDNLDIVEVQRNRAAFWANQCQVGYAEVFKQLYADSRLRTYRILP